MLKILFVALLGVGVALNAAHAAEPSDAGECQSHFSEQGSVFSGKQYATWVAFPMVAKLDAYTRVYSAIAKDGWTINSADRDAGIISATQSVSFGKGSTAPLTIVVEALNGGSKVSFSFRIGGGQVAKASAIRMKMCAYLNAVATP